MKTGWILLSHMPFKFGAATGQRRTEDDLYGLHARWYDSRLATKPWSVNGSAAPVCARLCPCVRP